MEVKQIEGITGHKQVHGGQRHSYGDSFDEWEIYTEDGKEINDQDVYDYGCALAGRQSIQTKEMWRSHVGDINSYFAGYYTIQKTSYGYYFTYVRPYTD